MFPDERAFDEEPLKRHLRPCESVRCKIGIALETNSGVRTAEETVLQRVLGILPVEQQRECSAKEPAAVAGKRRGNRIGISSRCSLDETTFVSCRI